jgi:phosphonate transport system substrate-binding protein
MSKIICQYHLLRLQLYLLVVIIVVLIFVSCGDGPKGIEIDFNQTATNEEIVDAISAGLDPEKEYLFGFDLRNGPREDARQYLPLLDYLSRKTGYRFKLHFSVSANDLLTELGSGKLHFAAIGAGTYLTASNDTTILPLVRGVNAKGELGYRTIFVISPGSGLEKLEELKGKKVAFGSPTSTQGHWIPRIMFEEAGITLDDLAGYLYTGSHRACAEAVIAGRVDACGMQDTLARLLIDSGAVRALATSEVFPSSGIFSSATVDAEIREKVGSVLVAFDPQGRDRNGLYHWEQTEMAGGFAYANADDYAMLRAHAELLGLLPIARWSAEAK